MRSRSIFRQFMRSSKNWIVCFSLLAVTTVTAAAGEGKKSPDCPMGPSHLEFRVPKKASMWLAIDDWPDASCRHVPDTAWTKVSPKISSVWVHADGPSGSGRYWVLTVGVGSARAKKPARGFCLATSTIGWRTLQRFGALPWVGDSDKDGNAELVVWNSFALTTEKEHPGNASYGLVAWVYELDSKGVFRIDWNLSRRMAARVVAAYREPLKTAPLTQVDRRKASDALEAFVRQRCRIRLPSAR